MVPKDQILIGLASAALCGLGLAYDRWFLERTKKGQALVRMFGEERAVWVLRILFAAGVVFGVLLAAGIVNPIRWSGSG